MTEQADEPRGGESTGAPAATGRLGEPTLAEDLLLLLFQPDTGLRQGTGVIAGENTLFYVLAGAVLADLALQERVTTTTGVIGTISVHARPERAPSDEILRRAWDYVSGKPRGVQTVLAAIGPALREPVLERLIARGDIRRTTRKTLGLFTTSALEAGESGRRAGLLAGVRDVLVDGADPTPRVAALAALIWGSGTLPQFSPEIPWTGSVIARAQELERGNWGAGAASEAVTRTMAAIVASSAVTAATVLARK